MEPVVPAIHLTVVGRSPMAHTLADLARALDWDAEVVDAPGFTGAGLDDRAVVVVATQGHGDEEALERALSADTAFVGLVASAKRGESVLGYLAERGVPRERLDRVRVPVGLDLGHTAHREIAVSILAELVRLRAAGELGGAPDSRRTALPLVQTPTAVDPVCGMTVNADAGSYPLELHGTTYWFCCVGCHDRFEADPARYLSEQEA